MLLPLLALGCAVPPPPADSAATSPDGGQAMMAPDAGAAPLASDAAPTKRSDDMPPPEDDSPALHVSTGDPSTCGLTINDVALYQAVKVLLVKDGVEVKKRPVDVVENHAALVRVFLQTSGSFAPADVSAALTITAKGQAQTLTDHRTISAASTDGDLASTLDFDVPAEQLVAGASYAITLAAPSACAAVRFPASGAASLRPRHVGTLKVQLVPLRYGTDGSDRLPDTSDEQLARFRARLEAMYPAAAVDLTVHAPVRTMITVTGDPAGWNSLLDAMRDLRAQDHPADDVFYFGLIQPADTIAAYCPDACYLGLSFRPDDPTPKYQAGVGLGYTGEGSAGTLAHELGHMVGRKHAPCQVSTFLDPQYPESNGATGSWGWDARTRALYAPDTTRDLMGYCSPAWVSDYTYGAFVDRLAKINDGQSEGDSLDDSGAFRVLLVDEQGRPRWGVASTVVGAPAGNPGNASVLDASGAVIAHVPAWRTDLGEGGSSWLVPAPQPGWASVQLDGAEAIRFDEPSVPPLAP